MCLKKGSSVKPESIVVSTAQSKYNLLMICHL